MAEMTLKNRDRLDTAVTNLKIITYLRDLIWWDIEEGRNYMNIFGRIQGEAETYLLERQFDIVMEFNDILKSDYNLPQK